MNQQPQGRQAQGGQMQQASPLTFDEITDKPIAPAKDSRRWIRIIHKASNHILQFPTLMEPGPLKDMLDAWEADKKYLRSDLLVEQVDGPNVSQWVKICESKTVVKVDDVIVRGPLLAEPESIKQFLRDEAYRLLPQAYHDGKRNETDKATGKLTARAQEIEKAIDEKAKTMCAVIATEQEIKNKRSQGAAI